MDWGSIAQIGAAVLPAIFGGGSSGSAPSTGGGTNWGAILAALGSQAAKIQAVPNAGASESDIKKANRINLLAGLLGGGVSALGTSMVQERQGQAYSDALKILGRIRTTTGQPITPGGTTGAVGGTQGTLDIPVIGKEGQKIYDAAAARDELARQGFQDIGPGGVTTPMQPSTPPSQAATAATPSGLDIGALGPLLGRMSPEQSKVIMGQIQQQQKILDRATRPMGLTEWNQAINAARQEGIDDPGLVVERAKQLLTAEEDRRVGMVPSNLQGQARERISSAPSSFKGLFGEAQKPSPPPSQEVSPALRGLVGPKEAVKPSTEIARRQEPAPQITPEMRQGLSADELATLENQGVATGVAPTQADTFLAAPPQVSPEIETVRSNIAQIEAARNQALQIKADPSRPFDERRKAEDLAKRLDVVLKDQRSNLQSLQTQQNVERRLGLEAQRIAAGERRGEEQGKRAEDNQSLKIIDTADAAAKDAFNAAKLPDTTRALVTGTQLLEGGKFSQTRAAETFKRSIDGTGVIGGELVQMLNDIRPELAQRVNGLFSRYANIAPSKFTDKELADLRRGFAVSTMVAYQQIADIQSSYRDTFRRRGDYFKGKVPDAPYNAEAAKLAASYDKLIQKIPLGQRQGLPVSIRGLTSDQINDSYDGINLEPTGTLATSAPAVPTRNVTASDVVRSFLGMGNPTPTPTPYKVGDQVGRFVIEGQITR